VAGGDRQPTGTRPQQKQAQQTHHPGGLAVNDTDSHHKESPSTSNKIK